MAELDFHSIAEVRMRALEAEITAEREGDTETFTLAKSLADSAAEAILELVSHED